MKNWKLKFFTVILVFLGIIVGLTAYSLGNNDENNNELESKFIGEWLQEDGSNNIRIFSNSILIIQNSGLYRSKGTWSIERPNRLVIVTTHSGLGNDVANIVDLPVNASVAEWIFEFISNSEMKWKHEKGYELIFTRLK